MNRSRTTLLFVLLPLLALLLAGCGPARPSAYSDEEVLTVTSRILSAMDANDYEAFIGDFSPEMLAAFGEDQFNDLRLMTQSTSGSFVSTGEMSLSDNKGYAVYRIICSYELEDVVVTIVFKVDGTQVEGLFFDSPNLRTTPAN